MLIRTAALFFFALVLGTMIPRVTFASIQLLAVQQLLKDVKLIASPGLPGNLSVYGPDAWTVIQDRQRNGAGSPVVAAASYGKGRVLLFGHTAYLSVEALRQKDTERLFLNGITWCAGKDSLPRIAVARNRGLIEHLREQGFQVEGYKGDLIAVDVLVISAHEIRAEQVEALRTFVENGGGLISAATGWGWVQLNPGKDLRLDLAANRLFMPMGLVFADGTVRDTAKDGFVTEPPPSPLTNATVAFEALREGMDEKEGLVQIGTTLGLALHSIPPEEATFLPVLRRYMAEQQVDAVPTVEDPITDREILARLVLTEQVHKALQAPPEEVIAHPSAAHFPGSAPEGTPTVSRTITFDTSIPGWHSTGLYANPGAPIRVNLPAGATELGLKLRFGSTTCRNWRHDKWLRAPEITREFLLDAEEVPTAHAFGGLLYLVVPEGCEAGEIEVTLEDGVEAPYFRLGHTSVEEWQRAIRSRPAPWAELASEKAILTVPSSEIRGLDDPERLLWLWDRILDTCAELAAWPSPERDRPQRYVADVQLCAGWMHAGNPIMIPTVTAGKLVDADYLTTQGDWGFFHETGHNHQVRDWTFDGTGEVTVNLFSMYLFEKICGIEPQNGRMAEEGIQKQYREYFASGADFEQWKRKPFLALMMYYQLQQAFGWDAYKRVFAEYRGLPNEERPQNDDERRDQWLVRFSRTVGKNLGTFFEAWHVPTSEEARASLADLPVWLPEAFPPE